MAADGYWRYAVDPRDQGPAAPPQAPLKRPRPDYPVFDPKELHGGPEYYGHYPRQEERMGHQATRDTELMGASFDRYYHNGVSAGFGESLRPVTGGAASHPVDDRRMMGVRGIDGLNTGYIGGNQEKLLPQDASNTLFIEGLPSGCTRREVSHIFRPFVGFKEVRLVNKESKRPGGDPLVLCFVDFSTPSQAAVALDALQGYTFDEHDGDSARLRLQFARFPGPRSGGGPRGKR